MIGFGIICFSFKPPALSVLLVTVLINKNDSQAIFHPFLKILTVLSNITFVLCVPVSGSVIKEWVLLLGLMVNYISSHLK